MLLDDVIKAAPVIAILRGLSEQFVEEICNPLLEIGVKAIEVPLNRPGALQAIEAISKKYGGDIALGAGTVLSAQSVIDAKNAGAGYIISPNFNPEVVLKTLDSHLISMPGICTPSEFFAAYNLGVKYFKLFPFEILGKEFLKALTTIKPADAHLIPVGGVRLSDLSQSLGAGAFAVGIASDLYKPELSKEDFMKNIATLKQEIGSLKT